MLPSDVRLSTILEREVLPPLFSAVDASNPSPLAFDSTEGMSYLRSVNTNTMNSVGRMR